MHARFRSPLTGRFLSVNPKTTLSRSIKRPQAWNRYSYVVGNPLKYLDPTGEIFELLACGEGGNADECADQTQLLLNALGDSADQIRVNVDGTVSLAMGVSASQFASGGEFQKALLMLIGDTGTFSLATGTGEGASSGGGVFKPDKNGGGTIYLEPGMFPRQTGNVMGTAEIALVHETGHALRKLFPDFYDRTNALFVGKNFQLALRGEGYAINFENRYRQSIGAEIRHSYHPSITDVLIDFDVNLFPAN